MQKIYLPTTKKEIVSDTLTRNREFQEHQRKKLERLVELNAPQMFIDDARLASTMTIAEYELYRKEMAAETRKESRVAQAEYVKNNPIRKEIADKIYSIGEGLSYEYISYDSSIRFHMLMGVLKFVSESDYRYGVYDAFIDDAHRMYRKRFETQYEKDTEDDKIHK